MPITPLHLGPVILIHGITSSVRSQWIGEPKNRLSILLLYIGCVIPDLQGAYSIFINRRVELHGFSHTLVGAFIYTLIISSILFLMMYSPLSEYLEFHPVSHFVILILAIIAFHFLPDIFIWSDMNILWPFGGYSPGRVENYGIVAFILFMLGVLGTIMLGIGYLKSSRIPIVSYAKE